jgi:hypothetical protein
MLGDEDTGERILGTAPPESGSRLAMIEFQPCFKSVWSIDFVSSPRSGEAREI